MPTSFVGQGAEASPPREQSPEPPPYSPITPVDGSIPEFPGFSQHGPDFMDIAPASEPINETTNSDAIALRAALGILQIQRQRALRDMQTLEQQKDKALDDPEAFSRGLVKGSIRSRSSQQAASLPNPATSDSDDDSENGERDVVSDFGEIPTAQNVARCPPINWSKYHVAGEVLDKLHEEQQTRPDSGHTNTDRAPIHNITAPYNPWKDKLPEKPARGRGEAPRRST